MKGFALSVYGAFALLGVGLGIAVLIRPALALPPGADSPLTRHLIREEGAEGLFIGLMAFWCFRHFEQRRPVHLALLLFALLFAAIHWAEYFADRRHFLSPALNSVPFLLLAASAPWKESTKSGSKPALR